ncbi:serine O-acetyltransferase [Enterococcus pernyi]
MKLWIMGKIREHVLGYDSYSYWKMRIKVSKAQKSKFTLYFLLYRLKRIEGKNNSSLGTNIGVDNFQGIPTLPHGLSGIYVSPNAYIGENARIFQQVTIGQQNGRAPYIGKNVEIGSGAKIIGQVTIGNNVKIGANSVVITDIPDNCFVAGVPAKIKKIGW